MERPEEMLEDRSVCLKLWECVCPFLCHEKHFNFCDTEEFISTFPNHGGFQSWTDILWVNPSVIYELFKALLLMGWITVFRNNSDRFIQVVLRNRIFFKLKKVRHENYSNTWRRFINDTGLLSKAYSDVWTKSSILLPSIFVPTKTNKFYNNGTKQLPGCVTETDRLRV